MYEELVTKKEKLCIIGLGYVGLPLANEFSQKIDVIGFDVDSNKVNNILNEEKNIIVTTNKEKIKECIAYIIAVPTPVDACNLPDLTAIENATKIVANVLKKGDYVIYESTVYPGLTEEVCIPLLEKVSGFKCGIDFKVGYSPERINPGDNKNILTNVVKLVSGIDNESVEEIAKLYNLIVDVGVYKTKTIKIAEAAKIIENTQRDINIAFINEVSMLFDMMGIESNEVLKAASTKWNFVNFKPGLVGGHCIGVDPYYLIYKAKEQDFFLQTINASRNVNENMSNFIVQKALKLILKAGKTPNKCKIAIMGLSFKENIDDIRNTKVIDIINGLKDYEIEIYALDPLVDKAKVKNEYGLELYEFDEINDIDMLILAVGHDKFKDISLNTIKQKGNNLIIMDIKNFFDKNQCEELGIEYWSL